MHLDALSPEIQNRITDTFRLLSEQACPPPLLVILRAVVSRDDDFINGTNGHNLGHQITGGDPPPTTTTAVLTGPSDTEISVAEVREFSGDQGFLILGDPTGDASAGDFEIISYANINYGVNKFETLVRGLRGTTAQTWASGTDVEQLEFDSQDGATGTQLGPMPHEWRHTTAGSSPPAPFGANVNIVGTILANKLYVFHPTVATNPVFIFDFAADSWSNPTTTGTYVPVRSAAIGADVTTGKMFILGGIDSGGVDVANTQEFDSGSNVFTQKTVIPRAGRTAGDIKAATREIYYLGKQTPAFFPEGKRFYRYRIAADAHDSLKAFGNGSTRGFAAAYMPSDDSLYVIRQNAANNNILLHRYDVQTDEHPQVATPPVVAAPYRMAADPNTANLAIHVDGTGPKQFWIFKTTTQIYTKQESYVRRREGPTLAWNDTAGRKYFVLFGGDTTTYNGLEGPGWWRWFDRVAVQRSRVLNVGVDATPFVPTGDANFRLERVQQSFGTVTFEAEHASISGGPFTGIGEVNDGDALDLQFQFWRIETTFTTDGDIAPYVNWLEVSYDTQFEMTNRPDSLPNGITRSLTGDALLMDAPSIAGKVDLEKGKGSLSGVNVQIADEDGTGRRILEDFRLKGKEACLSIGYAIRGFTKSDELKVLTGSIQMVDVGDGVVNISVKDTFDFLKKKVPVTVDAALPTPITYSSISLPERIVLVLLNLLQQAGIPERHIDDDSFTVADANPNADIVVNRTIAEPREVRKWAEPILQIIDGILRANEEGRLELVMYDPTVLPMANLTPNEVLPGTSMSVEEEDIINQATTFFDPNGDEDSKVTDYAAGEQAIDAARQIEDRIAIEDLLLASWLGPAAGATDGETHAAAISLRRLTRKKDGVQRLKLDVAGHKFAYLRAGDIVRCKDILFFGQPTFARHAHHWPYAVQNRGQLRDTKWLVTKKKVDFEDGKVGLELQRARIQLTETIDTMEEFAAVQFESEQIEFTGGGSGQEPILIAGEATGFLTLRLDMDQCPDGNGTIQTTFTLPAAAVLKLIVSTSHTGDWDGAFEEIVPVVAETLTTSPHTDVTTLKLATRARHIELRYEFTRGTSDSPILEKVVVDFADG